jgi:hypothetical protein
VAAPVQLTLIGKPECHLCDVAKGVVDRVVGELPNPASVTLEHRSILDDPELYERYWEQIPVVLVNGAEHAHWHVDAAALRAAILEV